MKRVFGLLLVAGLGTSAQATIVGPDAFGYTGSDEDGVRWEDISGTGTALGGGDDGYYRIIPSDFTFNYYGNSYSEFSAGTNGVLYFVDVYLGLGNTEIPGTNGYGVDRFMAPLWDDLVVDGTILYEVRGSGAQERMIVQWDGVRNFGGSGSDQFQTVIYADGNIWFNYNDVDDINPNASYTVGIQEDPTLGLQWSYNAAVLANGTSIHWVVPAPGSLALLGLGGLAFRRRR